MKKQEYDSINLKSYLDITNIVILQNVPASLSSSKSYVNELDVDQVKSFPIDLNNFQDVVKGKIMK